MGDLPKDYDVIVVGTGLTESILAAALSRIGKYVLHLDANEFYGSDYSSHLLTNLIELGQNKCQSSNEPAVDRQETKVSLKTDHVQVDEVMNEQKNQEKDVSNESDDDLVYECSSRSQVFVNMKDVEFGWTSFVDEEKRASIIAQSRRFSIDLNPNIFYSRGKFIELLISSDVSKYSEFRLVSRILARNHTTGSLEKVPTSRSEVFKSSQLNMIEKNQMMKFVRSMTNDENSLTSDESERLKHISFAEYVRERKMSDSVSNYLVNALAMCSSQSDSALKGLDTIRKFLLSVGRYGDSPFLYSLYGAAELQQCFCRLAAVFGAIYYLNLRIQRFCINKQTNLIKSIDAITKENEKFTFTCKHLVVNEIFLSDELKVLENSENTTSADIISGAVSRAILITDKSMLPNSESNDLDISFYYHTQSDKSPAIYCIEASSASMCCPAGYYLVYLFCQKPTSNDSSSSLGEHFKEFIELFMNNYEIGSSSQTETTSQETAETENEQNDMKKAKIDRPINNKPNVLFKFFFSNDSNDLQKSNHQAASTKTATTPSTTKTCTQRPSNMHVIDAVIDGGRVALDYDREACEAERLFRLICTNGEEFLPKPPAQEDIIFGDEDDQTKSSEEEESGEKKVEANEVEQEEDQETAREEVSKPSMEPNQTDNEPSKQSFEVERQNETN